MKYNDKLPYGKSLHDEEDGVLDKICNTIALCAKAGDFERGVNQSVKLLSRYFDLKYSLCREKRGAISRLLFDLIVTPGLDLSLVESWSNCCIRLIRKPKKLGKEDLTLPWRPLYLLIKRLVYPKSREKCLLSDASHVKSIMQLTEEAQRFFSADAAKEIMEEFLPMFSTRTISDAMKAQAYIVLFLPVASPRHSVTGQFLIRDDMIILSPIEYLPTIFSLWSIFTRSTTYDFQFINLISRVAKSNLSSPGSNYDMLFSEEQTKMVFTIFLRLMNLPVGSKGDNNVGGDRGSSSSRTGYVRDGCKVDAQVGRANLLRKQNKIRSIARFIVYSILPYSESSHSGSSYTLNLLSELIQATEIYFHPSNHGLWSYFLTDLVKHLSYLFLQRWRDEQDEDCIVPQHRRLTVEIKRNFVTTLRPVVYLSMFGKDHQIVSTAHSASKYLACLEPSIILPGLLERVYPSLEAVEETHRTSSALGLLIDISLPLLSRNNYPGGGKHLLQLLYLAIPGIDTNDPSKSSSTLLFIASALATVPIRDLTQDDQCDISSPDIEPIDIDSGNINFETELPREAEDQLCRMITGDFDEWLTKFLHRIFTLVENLLHYDYKMQSSATETNLVNMILHTTDIVFGQLSPRMYSLALKMVMNFVTERVLTNAVRAVGLLCGSISAANPKAAASQLIPLCIENIRIELEHGAASTTSNSTTSNPVPADSTFHWYQHILFSTIGAIGSEILEYKTDIINILEMMIMHCRSYRGIMWTGKLLRNCLQTALNIYPLDYRSMNRDEWENSHCMATSYLKWGIPCDPDDVVVNWHVPSEEEKAFSIQLMNQFITPALDHLQELIDQPIAEPQTGISYEKTNGFCRQLTLIRNFLIGSAMMVTNDGIQDERQLDGESDILDIYEITFAAGHAFSDPEDPSTQLVYKTRQRIGQILHETAVYFNERHEDSVECMKMLCKSIRTFICERGTNSKLYERQRAIYGIVKSIATTPHHPKILPRNLLVWKLYEHHMSRVKAGEPHLNRTTLYDDLLNDLIKMSLGYYQEIRKVSHPTLVAASKCIRGSKKLILPAVLEALCPDETIAKDIYANRMEGSLYILTQNTFFTSCMRDWKFIPSFIMSICRAQHEDKASIQVLISKLFQNYLLSFNEFPLQLFPGSEISTLADNVASTDPLKIEEVRTKVENYRQRNIELYQSLIDELLQFQEDENIHWRFETMAAGFLVTFIRPDMPLTEGLAKFAKRCILSESHVIRSFGIGTTARLLLYVKQRTISSGNEQSIISQQTHNPLCRIIETNEANVPSSEHLLAMQSRPLSNENAQDSYLIDGNITGWYAWPKRFKAYIVCTDETAQKVDKSCQELYDEFYTAFQSKEFWTTLLDYMSQETTQKHEDSFSGYHMRFYSSIFKAYQDEFLDIVKCQAENLCKAYDQNGHQRAASELLAGIVRGMKHWPLCKVERTWNWLLPLISTTLENITPDTRDYWQSFLQCCMSKRDPRRVLPLINLILNSKIDPTTDAAFAEATKIMLARLVIRALGWRALPFCSSLMTDYMKHIQHPYKQVRECIGRNINEILQLKWVPSFGSVEIALLENSSQGAVGNALTEFNLDSDGHIQSLIQQLWSWREEIKSLSFTSSSNYANACKTVNCWLFEAFTRWHVSGTLPLVNHFLPVLFQMEEIKDDQDLQQMTARSMRIIAHADYPSSMVPMVLNILVNVIMTSTYWHVRISALSTLQVFLFKHIFLLNDHTLLRIMDLVSSLLLDSKIEVRQMAAITLGGLVRCSQRDAISSICARYSDLISSKLPKRVRDKETGKVVESSGYKEAVLKRHAGVLGLSCLVGAFPYEMPSWMPSVLCRLADCMSDPAEIQATVQKTFTDFRRTHSDTWHEDKAKFTDDQLAMLTDMLISPSYYA